MPNAECRMPNGKANPELGICHSPFAIQAAFFSGLVVPVTDA
jgi:hypothetical protein